MGPAVQSNLRLSGILCNCSLCPRRFFHTGIVFVLLFYPPSADLSIIASKENFQNAGCNGCRKSHVNLNCFMQTGPGLGLKNSKYYCALQKKIDISYTIINTHILSSIMFSAGSICFSTTAIHAFTTTFLQHKKSRKHLSNYSRERSHYMNILPFK